jgi:ubiquinone/menaquinone biosynthesis C-methylase UbiE
MGEDTYLDLAERYDWMKQKNPTREAFFGDLVVAYDVEQVLDCACGTGGDLILFHSFGCEVHGSDLSDAMLAQARDKVAKAGLSIPIQKADFRHLSSQFDAQFDAVVCLSNAINELLNDADALQALRSMKGVLRDGGILVLDQGQTDASMKNPPRFAPVVNERDFSRLFVMDYVQDRMQVHIFDFVHTEDVQDFWHNSIWLRIRLQDDWKRMIEQAGFSKAEFFGDWQGTAYDKEQSRRLIVVAQK